MIAKPEKCAGANGGGNSDRSEQITEFELAVGWLEVRLSDSLTGFVNRRPEFESDHGS